MRSKTEDFNSLHGSGGLKFYTFFSEFINLASILVQFEDLTNAAIGDFKGNKSTY